IDYTVVICTRNRAHFIGPLLEELQRQSFPADRYDVLVVDNGSKDETSEVVSQWETRTSGRVRHFPQPEPGLGRSRKEAAKVARGEILLFLDDDATPRSTWLAEYDGLFQRHPACEIAGGPIQLSWETERPRWLRPAEECWYAGLDLGTIEHRV